MAGIKLFRKPQNVLAPSISHTEIEKSDQKLAGLRPARLDDFVVLFIALPLLRIWSPN